MTSEGFAIFATLFLLQVTIIVNYLFMVMWCVIVRGYNKSGHPVGAVNTAYRLGRLIIHHGDIWGIGNVTLLALIYIMSRSVAMFMWYTLFAIACVIPVIITDRRLKRNEIVYTHFKASNDIVLH